MARGKSTRASRTPTASGYVVDEHAVAEAILRRLRGACRHSDVLVAGQSVGDGAVGAHQDNAATGADLA